MPEFLHIIWAVFLIVVFFGGSIFVHELGHYLAARRRGLKVERFSIGFGPKLWSFQRDGVEWCISLFPLGGYVALPQLADLEGIEGASKTKEKLPKISYADTVIVAVMGVVFNMIFAFVLATILWVSGRPMTDSQQTTTIGTVLTQLADAKGVQMPSGGELAGLKAGDKIVTIDGTKVKNWRDVKQLIVTGVGRDAKGEPLAQLTVERSGKLLTINAQPTLAGPEKLRSLGLLPAEELFVGQIFKGSPAERAGVNVNDRIVALDGVKVNNYFDYSQMLEKAGEKTIKVTFERGDKEVVLPLTPQKVQISRTGKQAELLGFGIKPKMVLVHQDPFSQISDAVGLTWRTLTTLVHPDSDIKITHLSGPPGIAWAIYRLSEDIRSLLSFIVIINVNLAILNLLPLPVLDGGHIVLATINRFRKKPVSAEYISVVQNIFTILLLGLMLYVIFFADAPRVGRDWKEQQSYKKEQQEAITPDFTKAVTKG